MNNSVLAGIIVGGVVLAAAGSIVATSGYNPLQKYATVVAVEPAFDTTRTPRQVCGDEATLAAASLLGASLPGEETVAATPVPPPAPAPAKPHPETPVKAGSADADVSTECIVVYDTSSTEAGFDVTYELDGTQKVVRMDHDPGKRIPVENGVLVTG